MADELRPRPVPRPAASQSTLRPEQLPGEGRPPLEPGKVHMTDMVRKNLEAVGWKDGDPIPGDLGVKLREIQQELIKEQETAKLQDSPLAANWKPVQASFVNIVDLPPEKQAEIRSYLQEYKEEIATQAEIEKQNEEIERQIPGSIQGEQRDIMREQIAQGRAAQALRAQRQTAGQQIESVIVDDRDAAPAATTAATASAPSPPPPAEPVAALPSSGVPEHTNCQRCNWPLDTPFDVEPTQADKEGFLAAILGLGRFVKQYALLGGNFVLSLRSLSSKESAMVQQQLGAMLRSGEIAGDGAYWAHMIEYRMVLSVATITVGGNVVYNVPDIEKWNTETPPTKDDVIHPTPIPRLCEYFYKVGAPQEMIRRIIGQEHAKFQRLVEALEAMTSVSDFWQGIELRA